MSIQAPIRAVLALVLFPLAGCGPEPIPDYWGAMPRREMLDVPRPQFAFQAGGAPGYAGDAGGHIARLVSDTLKPALKRVDELTADKLPDATREGLEWRSSPGLADAFVWRYVLENVNDTWSSTVTIGEPQKPAQSWRFRLEVKPKMHGDDAFAVVLDGTRETPAGDWRAELGTGTLRLDWRRACAAVDRATCEGFPSQHGGALASVEVGFSLEATGRALDVALEVTQPVPQGANHSYYRVHGTSEGSAGTLQTETWTEHAVPSVASGATSVARMEWAPDGAGRADYVTPWLGSTIRGVACWGADAVQTYSRQEGGPSGDLEMGDASACVVPVAKGQRIPSSIQR